MRFKAVDVAGKPHDATLDRAYGCLVVVCELTVRLQCKWNSPDFQWCICTDYHGTRFVIDFMSAELFWNVSLRSPARETTDDGLKVPKSLVATRSQSKQPQGTEIPVCMPAGNHRSIKNNKVKQDHRDI